MLHALHRTPLGSYLIVLDDGGALVHLHRHRGKVAGNFGPRLDDAAAHVSEQLDEYLAGTRRSFDLAVKAAGTEFQRKVWDGLLGIDYGQTLTYGELAARLGNPGAARSVGSAAGKNPVALVIPCHRLVGAGGRIGGYSGGEGVKERLLALEAGRQL